MKIVHIDRKKSSYLFKKTMNFDEILKRDEIYDNIKSHKKPGFHLLYRRYNFGKTTRRGGRVQVAPSLLIVEVDYY